MKTNSIQSEMIARTALAATNSANYFKLSSIAAAGQSPLGLGATTDHRHAGARLQV